MPTPPVKNPANLVGKTEHLDLQFVMDPGIRSVFDSDVDDNENFALGNGTDLVKSTWLINVDHGTGIALAFVDDDGDAVVVVEVGTSTSKFSSTIGATNAQYQFGLSSGVLTYQNTDGDNQHVQILRLT